MRLFVVSALLTSALTACSAEELGDPCPCDAAAESNTIVDRNDASSEVEVIEEDADPWAGVIGDVSPEDDTATAGTDTGATAEDTPVVIEPGEFGAPCASNEDCYSGWCVEGPSGYICTQGCEQTCPEGFDCKSVGGEGDVAFLCMPRVKKLCAPCTDDVQCNGGACLPLDGQTWCGYSCNGDEDCPDGYDCAPHASRDGDGTWCQPRTGSCTCTVDFNGGQRSCSITNERGTCYGVQTCISDAGWDVCTALTPSVETCDGLDNDCNGLIDDALSGQGAACDITNEFGSCQGTQSCVGNQGFVCDAQQPALDVCDLADNDCDGLTDEDFKAADGAFTTIDHCGGCGNSCVGKFPHGEGTCSIVAGSPQCVVAACDEGYYKASDYHCAVPPNTSCQPCEADDDCFSGICTELDGELRCAPSCGLDADCLEGYSCVETNEGQTHCLPTTGSCSCNASSQGAQRTCTAESVAGTCYGVEVCDLAQGWTGCDAPTPSPELCDGLDNDCDGLIDDGLITIGEACTNTVDGVGSCSGITSCQGTGGLVCQGPQPTAETCDFTDNNCDGLIDETFQTDGVYDTYDHCGTCYASCGLGFPNAVSTECKVNEGVAQCVVTECEEGFIKLNDFQCIQDANSLCQACTSDADCLGEQARCLTLADGQFCGKPCTSDAECPDGYGCTPQAEGAAQCAPSTNACGCDGSNTDLSVTCSLTYTPNDPSLPETVCNGQRQCTAQGWSDCGVPPETCDGLDNDCNGEIDEPFKGIDGQYASVEHCGACNVSCLALSVANATPTCITSGPVPACSFTCQGTWEDVDGDASNGCECQPQDGPDNAGDGVDTNCDGIDGEVWLGVFVTKTGDDNAPGTIDAPMLTLTAALERAVSEGLRDVYVATGVYSESIALRDGVGIFGGYSGDFQDRDVVLFETAIIGQEPSEALPGAVNASSIGLISQDNETILDGFTVFGANAANQAGANSYAIYVWSSGSGLRLSNNRVFGGAGGNGGIGSSGIDGDDGINGASGAAAEDLNLLDASGNRLCNDVNNANSGGSGGAHVCADGANVSGGAGGASRCPVFGQVPSTLERGQNGTGTTPGNGGGAGLDLKIEAQSATTCSTCVVNGDQYEGLFGTDGSPGADGSGGVGCNQPTGLVVNGHWQGRSGGVGGSGTHGSGGGGGGSGAGVEVIGGLCTGLTFPGGACCTPSFSWGCAANFNIQSCVCAIDPFCCNTSWDDVCVGYVNNCGGLCSTGANVGGDDLGGSGGGAGSGGCLGSGGEPGAAGGGSFGIFIAFPGAPSSIPVVKNNTIRAGSGGFGGNGGFGGVGGQAGAGAAGGTSGAGTSGCAFAGGEGGNGGRGGHGGGGGGGCGGASYGLYIWPDSAAAASQSAKTDNTFLPGGSGGQGGLGGVSLGVNGNGALSGTQANTNL